MCQPVSLPLVDGRSPVVVRRPAPRQVRRPRRHSLFLRRARGWFRARLCRTWAKHHKDFGADRGNLFGVRDKRTIGIFGGTGDWQVQYRIAEVGDGDQVALVGGVNRFLGGRIFVELAAGENPIDGERSLRLLIHDPLAGVGTRTLPSRFQLSSIAIASPVGGSNLGRNRTGMPGLCPREEQTA